MDKFDMTPVPAVYDAGTSAGYQGNQRSGILHWTEEERKFSRAYKGLRGEY
jgi:hypothetical protein